ncbi:hypothetical protein Sjap_012314 [Stephania japonica]|uniref:Flowering-promoting factor 1-like protein 1 n=1 Tax=Stephania japonica TaxID=461633 RepID=A0AAP0IVP7_9MAGN
MSGVWVFDKKGVARLITNPTKESFEHLNRDMSTTTRTPTAPGARRRVLVYVPENQVIRSYEELEQRLLQLGWVRYYNERHPPSTDLIQFHRSHASTHLISLPKSFSNLTSPHMYDIVVKNHSFFEVRDHPA